MDTWATSERQSGRDETKQLRTEDGAEMSGRDGVSTAGELLEGRTSSTRVWRRAAEGICCRGWAAVTSSTTTNGLPDST